MNELRIFPVRGVPEVQPGDRLAELIAARVELEDGDVLVVTQKVVSKAEGRLVAIRHDDAEARMALVESESVRILRRSNGRTITETHHGFVCAGAGIDFSNVPGDQAALLPLDPDRSARRIRDGLRAITGRRVAVIVSDTFGRPWRRGLADIALGCAGIGALLDLRGTTDEQGRVLKVTEVAVVDELASAAELVMGKARGIAAAVVRGVDPDWLRESSVRAEIVRRPHEDLFR